MSEGKKKLSGYQNLINKRKREEVLDNTNKKITQFFKAPIDSTSEASVKNDDNMEPSTSSLVEVEETVTFIEADADEVFDSKTLQLSKDPELKTEKKKLTLWSDNCGGRNKNQGLLAVYITLVAKGHFDEVVHKFPQCGHTFLSCDRDFGCIEKAK
ncbi:hypothetical protein JTB14_030431 [Gonioctena quinquepunctata]|nr:hypothetical protein JTB14_030431 [Gonioctena quinquepunctata]